MAKDKKVTEITNILKIVGIAIFVIAFGIELDSIKSIF